jgi:hypothetical protein
MFQERLIAVTYSSYVILTFLYMESVTTDKFIGKGEVVPVLPQLNTTP